MSAEETTDGIPTAFVCHATEDKASFVEEFARSLRANGIDAWYDSWEMGPGDRLIDKIEAGIQNAEAFIIVLSRISVTKNWVREELNAGLIRAIDQKARVIPVLIEPCDVPLFLQSHMWVDMTKVETREQEFERLVNKLHGKNAPGKPPVIPKVSLTQVQESPISGLSAIESVVLKASCEIMIRRDQDMVDTDEIERDPQLATLGLTAICDAVERMDKSEIKTERVMANRHGWGNIYSFWVSDFGFERYASAYVADYDDLKNRVANELLISGHGDSAELAARLGQSNRIIAHIFQRLDLLGLGRLSDELGSNRGIYMIKDAKLRHAIENDVL